MLTSDAPRPRAPLTREAIVEAARRQVMEVGAHAVSLRRVAADLGVTAPALYAHVTGKREMLRLVAEDGVRRLLERFAAVDETDPVERIRQLSRAYVTHAVEEPELFRVMFLFPPDLTIGGSTGAELPLATQAFQVALHPIGQAIADGTFADADPLLASLTLWTATHGLADVLLLGFDFDDATRELLTTNVLDTVISGLRR
jgi:AcrR family transcriptional regulator